MIYAIHPILQLDWPVDWTAFFGRSGPLLLEIGFGGGEFLRDLAQRRPEANVLGIEISLPSLRKAQRKLARANVTNTRLLQGAAQSFLWASCAPESLAAIYLNFSDPWPKAGHHHRRVVSEPFLHLAATRMPAGAALDIATDHDDYAAAIADCLAATPYFDSRLVVPFVTEDNERIRTKYERKALAEGRVCRYFKYVRNDRPAPDAFPAPKELSMPHVIFKTPLTLAELRANFQPRRYESPAAHVRYVNLFANVPEDWLMVETHISEEPHAQRIGLVIRVREDGELVLNLHDIGFPRPTAGVHAALAGLAEWIQELAPTSEIRRSNLNVVFGEG